MDLHVQMQDISRIDLCVYVVLSKGIILGSD